MYKSNQPTTATTINSGCGMSAHNTGENASNDTFLVSEKTQKHLKMLVVIQELYETAYEMAESYNFDDEATEQVYDTYYKPIRNLELMLMTDMNDCIIKNLEVSFEKYSNPKMI
ncbi:MAG: hypothetical protein LBE36_06745 [Flavobacteriaceae bacterium]|jgi:hypothetical protein|nr:hypothetical protein [Flavobacteriaceae bacterium]